MRPTVYCSIVLVLYKYCTLYVQYKQYIFWGARRGIGFFLIRVSENYLCRKSLREKGIEGFTRRALEFEQLTKTGYMHCFHLFNHSPLRSEISRTSKGVETRLDIFFTNLRELYYSIYAFFKYYCTSNFYWKS